MRDHDALGPDPALLTRAREALAGASFVSVLTGAGMSAESGIPTFRDALAGLWANFDPQELASIEGFLADPPRVWDWYAERSEGVRRARPNAGHEALAAWGRAHPGRMCVVTQNVDDLHQRAGQPDVVRLHGDILARQWIDEAACTRRPRCDPAESGDGRPPRCARCGNLARPGVVWFGEALPLAAIERAQQVAMDCGVMLVVGTSGAVWPAAGLAGLARRNGATVVIVNPEESEIDGQAHVVLRGTAARVLPALLAPG